MSQEPTKSTSIILVLKTTNRLVGQSIQPRDNLHTGFEQGSQPEHPLEESLELCVEKPGYPLVFKQKTNKQKNHASLNAMMFCLGQDP